MKLEDDHTDQLMALAAFRYCLGRQSYIVGTCIHWLRATWPQLTTKTKHVVVRDIAAALMHDRAGHVTIDVQDWLDLGRQLFAEMSADEQQSVRTSVFYMQRPFPFDAQEGAR